MARPAHPGGGAWCDVAMRILVIGGTQFVGRHIVTTALARGHEVTLVHRGRTGADLFPDATHLHLDRDGDLAPLLAHAPQVDGFDATVDVCAYVPRQVRALGDALAARGAGGLGGHHVHISSISAYREVDGPGADESAPLHQSPPADVEEVDGSTYGPLKAACERAAGDVFGADLAVVRPSFVLGPWDSTGRFPYWVRRIAAGGLVAVPGPAGSPLQGVDGRDLAALVVTCAERGHVGALHAAAQRPDPRPYTFGDMVEAVAGAVAPAGTRFRWLPAEQVEAAGLTARALPLWTGGEPVWGLAVDPAAALSAGLPVRPVADTARDVLASDDTPDVAGVGLTPEQEALLLGG